MEICLSQNILVNIQCLGSIYLRLTLNKSFYHLLSLYQLLRKIQHYKDTQTNIRLNNVCYNIIIHSSNKLSLIADSETTNAAAVMFIAHNMLKIASVIKVRSKQCRGCVFIKFTRLLQQQLTVSVKCCDCNNCNFLNFLFNKLSCLYEKAKTIRERNRSPENCIVFHNILVEIEN